MWKLLRNVALPVLIGIGALKLGVDFAASRIAAECKTLLAPWATLDYAGSSAGFGGTLVLASPRVRVRHDAATYALDARSLRVETPGLIWLLRRAWSGDTGIPGHLAITIRGLVLPDNLLRDLPAGWIDPRTLVPFATQGCDGEARFTATDDTRLGVAAGERNDRLEYRYDATARTLELSLRFSSPPFARIDAQADLADFTSAALAGGAALAAVRVEQLGLDYADTGYLARRNAWCARKIGSDTAAFVERHLAAVDALLAGVGIAPAPEVRALYRQLVAQGGTLQLSALPGPGFAPDELGTYARADLLRLLNVTVRRNDAPPIMLQLAFKDLPPVMPATAPPTSAEAGAGPDADAGTAGASPDARPGASAKPPVPPEPAPSSAAAALTKVAVPAPVLANAVAAEPALARSTPAPIAAPPVAATVEPAAVPTPASSPRPAAMPSSAPVATADPTAALRPYRDPRESFVVPPSAPSPPQDSTLALVWQAPTIERLLPQPVPERDYDLIAASNLIQHLGARVRLLTYGGKSIEGRVRAADANLITLSVRLADGSARLQVPRANIREVQLLRERGARD